MSCTVYTFVGVSLLTNYNQFYNYIKGWNGENFVAEEKRVLKEKSCKEKRSKERMLLELKETLREPLKEWIMKTKAIEWGKFEYCDNCPTINRYASAEITSIVQFVEEKKENIEVILLSSDTCGSRVMAEILEESLNGCKIGENEITVKYDPQKNCIAGLQVDDYEKFLDEGIKNFLEYFFSVRNNNSNTIFFNITSGYKAFIPYITIMGQVYQFDCFYLFENQSKIITVPKFPIKFETKAFENYADEFNILMDGEIEINDERLKPKKVSDVCFVNDKLVENLIEKDDTKIRISILGRILYKKWRQTLSV